MIRSKVFITGLIAAMSITAFALVAQANPLQFRPTVQTNTATTSPAYLTAGTATSTVTWDSYAGGQTFATDQATLFIQLGASSTATTLNTNLEYSQDGIDWYQDAGTMVSGFATTSKPFYLAAVNQFTMTYASSTAGLGAVSASAATTTRVILVKTPVRYVRAIFTLPVGSAAGAVWGQWVGEKQNN